MKQKTVYLLLIICCMSFLPAANGNGSKCTLNACSKKSISPTQEQLQGLEVTETRFNFSPMDTFVLSI